MENGIERPSKTRDIANSEVLESRSLRNQAYSNTGSLFGKLSAFILYIVKGSINKSHEAYGMIVNPSSIVELYRK